MLDELYNAFLNASGFTESARKRDRYDDLHDYLKDKERELKQFIQEAESAKREYESKSNGLEANKIPAVEFEQKRHEKDEDLNTVLSYFKSALSDVGSAKVQLMQSIWNIKRKQNQRKRQHTPQRPRLLKKRKRNLKNLSIKHTKNGGNQHEW